MVPSRRAALRFAMFAISFAMILFELALTRVFAIVLFANFAHLALGVALLGIGVGALAQHLWPSLVPEERLERRLGWIALAFGASAVLAVIATVALPLTVQFDEPTTYAERSAVRANLLEPWAFAALLPALTVPFAVGGAAFAGAFQRRRAEVGALYSADLIGGAVGAVLFVPLLRLVSGPDAVIASAAACALAALGLFASDRARAGTVIAALATGAALIGLGRSATGHEQIPVRYAAGYDEQFVVWTRWTPLTRLSLHQDPAGTYMLLDTTSASRVVTTVGAQRDLMRDANRSAVYKLHDMGGPAWPAAWRRS